MRKVLLLIAAIIYMLSMNICYFKLATEVCDVHIMRAWQWLSIGLFFFVIQAVTYSCHMQTRIEKLILIISSSTIYYTIAVIVFTNYALIKQPYPFIISYNNLILAAFFIVLIASFYNNTFTIGYKRKSRRF